MIVHLPTLPTFILTSPATSHRIHSILQRLEPLGFHRLCVMTGRNSIPYWQGLNATIAKTLEYPAPFLALEDDASPHPQNYRPTIDVPADTDVINLGPGMATYQHAHEHGWNELPTHTRFPPLLWQPANDNFVRVGNMLFSHAVLYLSARSTHIFRETLKLGMERDVCDTFAQKVTNTLAPKHTFFYQLGGRHERMTRAGLVGLDL